LDQKYLLPHLRPPSTTSFQQTSSALTEQYDEAARLLQELQDQTTKLQTSVEEDRGRVVKVVDEVEEAVRSVREGEEQWREEMREIRGEVESVRELVPRVSGRLCPSLLWDSTTPNDNVATSFRYTHLVVDDRETCSITILCPVRSANGAQITQDPPPVATSGSGRAKRFEQLGTGKWQSRPNADAARCKCSPGAKSG